jgi:ribose-phosphate pyrophosphokinase
MLTRIEASYQNRLGQVVVEEVPYTSLNFAGGEVHVNVDTSKIPDSQDVTFTVYENIVSHLDFMRALMLNSALRETSRCPHTTREVNVRLYTPYFPYARQDRVCTPGDANAFTVAAKVLTDAFDEVVCWDIYNPRKVVGEVLSIPAYQIIKELTIIPPEVVVIPDEGAEDRAREVALALKVTQLVHFKKDRDPKTGDITGFSFKDGQKEKLLAFLMGRMIQPRMLVVDDICDGGRTFIELAKLIQQEVGLGRKSLELYTTHGIFSKGFEHLSVFYNKFYVPAPFPGVLEDAEHHEIDLVAHPLFKASK